MGLALLLLLYSVSAALLGWVVRPGGRRASLLAAIFLSLVPLAYTAQGFWKERTLAPTPMLSSVAPWADPELVARAGDGASAINPVLLDPATQMIPWSRAARDDLLFNPAQASGAALLGNGQSAVLFPTEVASRLLAPFRAITYSQAARLLLTAWGMFALIRLVGLGELAACAGAAVYVGAGFVQLWRLHPHSLVAAAAPWILAAALLLWQRPSPRSAALLALAGALGVAGGHPETLLHVMLFAALVVPALARIAVPLDRQSARPGEPAAHQVRWTTRLVWGAASAVVAFLLAAPILLPFLENLRASVEWVDRRPLGRTNLEAPLRDALERLRPAGALYALGDPVEGIWRGPENLAELGGAATGGAALFLAVLGATTARHRARRWALPAIAAVGLLGLLVSAHTPIVSAPFGIVPLLEDSLLKRLSLWWVLAVSILAAAAIDALRAAHRHVTPADALPAAHRDARATDALRAAHRDAAAGSKRLAIAAGAAAVVALIAVALAIGDSPPAEHAPMWIAEGAPIVLALIGAALIATASSAKAKIETAQIATAQIATAQIVTGTPPAAGMRRGRFAAGVALLLCALLLPRLWLFARWIPTTSPAGFYPNTVAVSMVVERLSESPRSGFRVTGIEAALPPHSAAFYGLEEIRSYDPMTLASYHRFLDAAAVPGPTWTRVLDPRAPVLSFLGVRFVFEDPPPPLPADPGAAGFVAREARLRRRAFYQSGLQIAYEGPGAVVWERADALPRAFFPRAWRIEPASRALDIAAKIDDFASIAIVDREPSSTFESGGGEARPAQPDQSEKDSTTPGAETSIERPNPPARVLALDVGRRTIDVEVEVDASADAILATSQPAIPGWRLTIDDDAASERLRTVNTAFLGVAVPAGRHRVVLRYAPTSWRLGLVLGVAGAFACVLFLAAPGLVTRAERRTS